MAALDNRMIPAWPTAAALSIAVDFPSGYHCEVLGAVGVADFIEELRSCYPGIAVGGASCFLRNDFYADQVFFEEGADRDFFVIVFKHLDEWAGMLSVERDYDSQVLYGRVGTVAVAHRGAGLSKLFPSLLEAIALAIGTGLVYALATLKVPNIQVGFERAGWKLIGIMPGFDRELLGPGDVKRVYEAVYVKVLASESEFEHPTVDGLTPSTRAVFEHLFPGVLRGSAATSHQRLTSMGDSHVS